jgi:hypothetical protein
LAFPVDRWALTLAALLGQPMPPLPDIPGRRITAHDEPLSEADIAGIDSPSELGRLLGISRQAAGQRLAKRKAAP